MTKDIKNITSDDVQSALDATFDEAQLTDENIAIIDLNLQKGSAANRQLQYERLFKGLAHHIFKKLGLEERYNVGNVSIFRNERIPSTQIQFKLAVYAVCDRVFELLRNPDIWHPPVETVPTEECERIQYEIQRANQGVLNDAAPDIGFTVEDFESERRGGHFSVVTRLQLPQLH